MEDTLQISAIEKDDSFSILYASLDTAKRDQMDELAEVGLMVSKLAEVSGKFELLSQSMADQLDALEVQHAEKSAVMQAEYTNTLKQLQDAVRDYTDKIGRQEAATNTVNQINHQLKNFLVSIRDQIEILIEEIEPNQNREEVVDVVTVDSGSEDGVSDHGHDNEEMNQEQAQAVESSTDSADVVQNGQETHETEQVQQNLSNGDAHDETVKPNDDEGKENVRPQSTPITHKAEDPAVIPVAEIESSVSTKSIIVTVPKVADPPKPPLVEKNEVHNIDEPGTSVMVQSKKYYDCIFCDEKFPKKSLVFQHWKSAHDPPQSTDTEGKLVRKLSSKRKRYVIEDNENDDEDAHDDEIPSTNGHYVIARAHANPMEQAMKGKRQKKTKIVYVARK